LSVEILSKIINFQNKRRSWCRSSLKGTKQRKSLPPFHQDVTELSKSISLDLPETDRLSVLLLSSFQVRSSLLVNYFSLAFLLGYLILSLWLTALSPLPLRRFAAECQAWDRLLLRHQESAEEMASRFKGSLTVLQAEPLSDLQTSQAHVLGTKPNYQQILDEQGQVLRCLELVLDELQQAVKLLQTFSEDSRQYLRHLSEQLGKREQLLNNCVFSEQLLALPKASPPSLPSHGRSAFHPTPQIREQAQFWQ
uniref:DSN1 component of MIS12 kinetochore complex n=1 Tax=Bubo bubo TaxID=30461 RepID=A0A8C0EPH5_BUBBB